MKVDEGGVLVWQWRWMGGEVGKEGGGRERGERKKCDSRGKQQDELCNRYGMVNNCNYGMSKHMGTYPGTSISSTTRTPRYRAYSMICFWSPTLQYHVDT
jgi:hypothetical protein